MLLTISGIVSAVSILVVVVVSAIYVKQRYELQKDYTTKIEDVTKQVNDVNKTKLEFDTKQQTNIQGTESNIDIIKRDYARKDDLGKNTTTEMLNAKNAFFSKASSETGLEITNDNPGPLVEKVYGNDKGNRYGIGNFDTNTRVFAGSSNAAAVQLGFANRDGTFKDIVTVQRNADKGGKMSLDGELILNNKFSLNGYNDEVIRIMDKDSKGLFGGLSMNTLDVKNTSTLGSVTAGNVSAGNIDLSGMISVPGTPSPFNPNMKRTIFNNTDKKNYIGGDATIYGNTSNIGNLDIGASSRLNFGNSNSSVSFNLGTSGLITNFQSSTSPAGAGVTNASTLSQQWKNNNTVIHEFDTVGLASHRAMKLGNNTSQNNMYFEAGRTADGSNEGMAAINFNGMTKGGVAVLSNPQKSRWRVGVDQTANNDTWFVDQATTDGKKRSYIGLSNDNVGIGTLAPKSKLHVIGGALQQQAVDKGPSWTVNTEGNEGVVAYDGSAFNFRTKGIKMINVNADKESVDITGTVGVSKNMRIKGDMGASKMWLDDQIGMSRTPTGYLGVIDKNNNPSSISMKEFNASSGGKLGKDGLQSEGDISSKAGLTIDKATVLKGGLTVNGDTLLNGSFALKNGSYMMDAQGNVVIQTAGGKVLTLGAADSKLVHLAPTDTGEIKIGKMGMVSGSAEDGHTRIRSYKTNANIMIGDENTNTVNVGNNAKTTAIGAQAKMNTIGKSFFPGVDGNVYIRPSEVKKDIMIGSDSEVMNIKIGQAGTKVHVASELCMEGSCMKKGDVDNVLDITRIKALPTMKFTNNDLNNVQRILPNLVNAPYNQLSAENVHNIANLSAADIDYLKSMPSRPAMQLTTADVTNVKALPTNLELLGTLTARDISNIKALSDMPPPVLVSSEPQPVSLSPMFAPALAQAPVPAPLPVPVPAPAPARALALMPAPAPARPSMQVFNNVGVTENDAGWFTVYTKQFGDWGKLLDAIVVCKYFTVDNGTTQYKYVPNSRQAFDNTKELVGFTPKTPLITWANHIFSVYF